MALAFVGESSNPASLSGTAGTTQTCTRTLTAGNAVIAYAVGISGSGTNVTFSDGVNTWATAKVVLPLGGGFQCIAVGYALNVAGGSTTVTATWNASAHHMGVILVEVSGAKTASALEGAGGQYQGLPGTGANAITSGNPSPAPTTTANCFVAGFTCNFNNNVAPTAVGTGFTQTGAVKWTAQMGGVQGEYKIVSATGTYPATFTCGTTNDNWTTLNIILAEASGSGITGTGSAAAQPFGASGSGTETFSGSGSAAAQSFGVSGSGSETFTGTGSAAAKPFAASGAGTVGTAFVGSGTAAVSPFGASATGAETFSGNGTSALKSFAVSGTGTASLAITGSGSAAMSRFAVSGSGFTGPQEPKLKTPLWAVFDEVSLTVEVDPIALSATADEFVLSVESDT